MLPSFEIIECNVCVVIETIIVALPWHCCFNINEFSFDFWDKVFARVLESLLGPLIQLYAVAAPLSPVSIYLKFKTGSLVLFRCSQPEQEMNFKQINFISTFVDNSLKSLRPTSRSYNLIVRGRLGRTFWFLPRLKQAYYSFIPPSHEQGRTLVSQALENVEDI